VRLGREGEKNFHCREGERADEERKREVRDFFLARKKDNRERRKKGHRISPQRKKIDFSERERSALERGEKNERKGWYRRQRKGGFFSIKKGRLQEREKESV